MIIQEYINTNAYFLIDEAKIRFNALNQETFVKVTVDCIRTTKDDFDEPLPEGDEVIEYLARQFYRYHIHDYKY